jgi:4-amino-4-deoxy-L-arabinose transferase-like glycosyltransferase
MNRLVRLTSRILEIRSTWLVAAITFVWLAATTWTRPLLLPDEGRYVGVAWNMLDVGQLWVPRLDGMPFFHKPPLFYWITAVFLDVFGVNEWAARLCSVLAATVMVAVLFWFLKVFAGRRIAIVSAIVLASQPFLFGAGQYANMDMTVACAIAVTVTLAGAGVFRMERGEPYRVLLTLAYAAAGFGFLSKGLIGIVLPGGIVVFWLIGRRRFDLMWRMFIWQGFVALAVVALPWMVYMEWHYPGFFHYYIVYQQFQRFLETTFNNRAPFWFYVPVLFGLALPWSAQIWRLAKTSYWKNPELGAIRGLMLSWFLVVLIFFSIPASKLIGYILPALPPLAFFLAEPFVIRLSGEEAQRVLVTLSRYLAIAVGLCLVAVVAILVFPQHRSMKEMAQQMRAQYRPADRVVMLDTYFYDLPFYLRTAKPAFVVSDWKNPKIPLHDNWRKELYDAGLFDPKAAAELLITPQTFKDKLCGPRTADLWLVGDTDAPDEFPFLKTMSPKLSVRHLRAWLVPAGGALTFCSETPKTAPK